MTPANALALLQEHALNWASEMDSTRGENPLYAEIAEAARIIKAALDSSSRPTIADPFQPSLCGGDTTNACSDCPIGNRAPEHADHDPTRGPCTRAETCDAEAVDTESGRGPGYFYRCPDCGSSQMGHLPLDAPEDWRPTCVGCLRKEQGRRHEWRGWTIAGKPTRACRHCMTVRRPDGSNDERLCPGRARLSLRGSEE